MIDSMIGSTTSPCRLMVTLAVLLICLAEWPHIALAKKARKSTPALSRSSLESIPESVFARDLVTEDTNFKSIVTESGKYNEKNSERRFKGPVLGYVTPWHKKGYDFARIFRGKFTHIAPVWFQLKNPDGRLKLFGKQDVDTEWIRAVKQAPQEGTGGSSSHRVKIVPRVTMELTMEDQVEIISRPEDIPVVLAEIVSVIKEIECDGITLEAWPAWIHSGLVKPAMKTKDGSVVDNPYKPLAVQFTRLFAELLHAQGMELLVVIPPPNAMGESMDPADTVALTSPASDALPGAPVDYFSVMTYDFSNPGSPGPNAPIKWVRESVLELTPDEWSDEPGAPGQAGGRGAEGRMTQKMLLGLNFFGNDYTVPQGGGPLVSHEFLDLLERERPEKIRWNDQTMEHVIEYTAKDRTRHTVHYPSLASIQARIALAQELDTGISIWELGQGLDYFYDLL